jgi:2-C-methyl-D-erythritol 4-phosphate cytidylyltransferase/2-C-methyl-D-erythritol 2,4-cyclodiphosphate synthase
MANSSITSGLIVAAGRGLRAGGADIPKQYQRIGGKPMLLRAIEALLCHDAVDQVRVVIGKADERLYTDLAPSHGKLRPPVTGGETRQDSVRLGLEALVQDEPARVLIHDGARPFVSPALIGRVASALDTATAVIPALPVASTLKRVGSDGRVAATVAREGMQAAETPQGFAFSAILAAHRRAAAEARSFTDDAAVAEWAGIDVAVVAGDPLNVKLTTADDIAAANRRLLAEEALRLGDVRVGIGYDIHALGSGHEVMLGGVAIPHARGLVGHSDADVVLHALTDAILGALAEGDIGAHFPPSDEQWKGVSSDRFLADAAARVAARGGVIAHLDVALVAEGPRIAPYRDAIRARIAAICGITPDRVGVKATTSEGLGFIGRGEGIAAHATATIRLPFAKGGSDATDHFASLP